MFSNFSGSHLGSTRGLRTTAVLVVLSLASLATRSNADPTFTQSCYTVNSSIAIVTGDFNGDGKLDIAMNASPPQDCGPPFFCISQFIDVYLGDGSGGFSGPTQFNATTPYITLATADVNRDGALDFVTDQDPFSVVLGNGNGTFQAPQSYSGGGTGVAVGDLNGDAWPDVVTGASGRKEIAVFLNHGDGTLMPAINYRSGDGVRLVTLADFDGDGVLDVAAASSNTLHPTISVLLGKGDGKFRMHQDTNIPFFPGRNIVAADLDGDGKLDLAVPLQGDFSNQGGEFNKGLLTLHGNGNGTFAAPVLYPMNGITNHLDVGDLNGDGSPDIVAGNYNAGTYTLLYNNGAGVFSSGGSFPNSLGLGVKVANINADSRLDFIVDGCVYLNKGPPLESAAVGAAKPTPITPAKEVGFSPNPVRQGGTLSFNLSKEGRVSVHLYDLRGRRVGTLLESAWMPAGVHSVTFDRAKTGVGSGLYFYRVITDESVRSGQFIVIGQ